MGIASIEAIKPQLAIRVAQGPRPNIEDTAQYAVLRDSRSGAAETVIAITLDGVGGQACGEVASALGGQAFMTFVMSYLLAQSTEQDCPDDGTALLEAMRQALVHANQIIAHQAHARSQLRGMATTAVGAVIAGRTLNVTWAGDSRCYLVRQGKARQITSDHSEIQELLDLRLIRLDDVKDHPSAHRITRYLGARALEPDSVSHSLAPNDVIVLCTDGLTDVLADHDIARHVAAYQSGAVDLDRLADRLVQHALDAGTGDNTTVLCCALRPPNASVNSNRTVTHGYRRVLASFSASLVKEPTHG